ncbi:MAG: glycerol-3-phosphate dehydrogenase [Myxococcales bacterium]|nr:glycerol-3-phosphate dehydrogenase [Myxococcales bacterium]
MAVFTVVGAGMMGSALCVPLADRGHEVRLVGTPLDRGIVESLRATGVHPGLRLALPSSVRAYFAEELAVALDGANVVGLGVSSAGLAWAGAALGPYVRGDVPVFGITKGLVLEGERLVVVPDALRGYFPEAVRERVAPAAIAGPCIAGELARRVPTCVVLTGRSSEAELGRLAALISTDYYHVFTSTDVVGTEVCAALKNAYAMGVSFGAGLHEKAGGVAGSLAAHNYESAVFAQATVEMTALVRRLGGRAETVAGLAGVGDLDVTNNGGRTGRFGRLLGLGLGVDEAIARMDGATLECLEILVVMRRALAGYRGRGELGEGELPLLEHLMSVALDGAAVAMPFAKFFGGRGALG